MKVWYIAMAFPWPSETFVCSEVEALRRQGVEVTVHAFRPPHARAKAMLTERGLGDLTVTHGSFHRHVAAVALACAHPGLVAALLQLIVRCTWRQPRQLALSVLLIPRAVQLFLQVQRGRPDVVHLYWGHYPSLLGYLIQRFLPRQPMSTSLAAYDLTLKYGCTAPVARRADVVRTWAAVNVPEIESLGVPSDRILLAHQGVDCSRRQPITAQRIPRRVVSAGRLIRAKGMDDVLRAFSLVAERWPDASLVVMGDGPERAALTQLAADLRLTDRVTFRGHVRHEDVFRELAQAEVFLFLSHHPAERLPNVVKEAIVSGCLCIVSDTPGIEELIRDGADGFIVSAHQPSAAAARLDAVFAGTGAGRADAAFARLCATFDESHVARSLVERWQRVIAAKAETQAPAASSSGA